MYWDITNITYIGGYILKLTFNDGNEGIVDLSNYSKRGGVFSNFSNPEYFQQVYLDHGVLCWSGDVDIAPETIYSMATGKPLPDWLENKSSEVLSNIDPETSSG